MRVNRQLRFWEDSLRRECMNVQTRVGEILGIYRKRVLFLESLCRGILILSFAAHIIFNEVQPLLRAGLSWPAQTSQLVLKKGFCILQAGATRLHLGLQLGYRIRSGSVVALNRRWNCYPLLPRVLVLHAKRECSYFRSYRDTANAKCSASPLNGLVNRITSKAAARYCGLQLLIELLKWFSFIFPSPTLYVDNSL